MKVEPAPFSLGVYLQAFIAGFEGVESVAKDELFQVFQGLSLFAVVFIDVGSGQTRLAASRGILKSLVHRLFVFEGSQGGQHLDDLAAIRYGEEFNAAKVLTWEQGGRWFHDGQKLTKETINIESSSVL